MYWIALTLGFLGSLHCIGMCGPLALAGLSRFGHLPTRLWQTILYNTGRTTSYMVIGFIFGLLGSSLALAGMQRVLSVLIGVSLIVFFVFSIYPDKMTNDIPILKKWYRYITNQISNIIAKQTKINGFTFGLANGFLPCGLVYLAIAGATSSGSVVDSLGFMLMFGLGTFPAMIGVVFAADMIPSKVRKTLTNMYPMISLILGIYLVYRGVFTSLPMEIQFLESLHDPIMCH